MCGSCKIVNISWPLFATLVIGRNVLTQKYTFQKWSLNTFSFVNCLFVGLCILCVKMKTFLCEESVLCHNKTNCFPSYLDHYLNEKKILKTGKTNWFDSTGNFENCCRSLLITAMPMQVSTAQKT